jgi:cell division protein FtsQ
VLVDREGMVMPADRLDRFGDLLVLVGDDAPPRGAALIELLGTEPGLQKRVVAAVRIGGRRWNLRFDNGVDVELPEDDAAGAWHRLAGLERTDAILQRNVLAIDLRLPDRLVVRLVPEPPKPAPKKGRQPGKST